MNRNDGDAAFRERVCRENKAAQLAAVTAGAGKQRGRVSGASDRSERRERVRAAMEALRVNRWLHAADYVIRSHQYEKTPAGRRARVNASLTRIERMEREAGR